MDHRVLPHWYSSEEADMHDPTGRYGGVDWATDTHAVCIVDNNGVEVVAFDVAHTSDGLVELCHRLHDARVVRVAIERPDGPVVAALMEDGFEVVVVSSRSVKALRERYHAAGNKSDRSDAYVLADCLRTDGQRWSSLKPDTPAPRSRSPTSPCSKPCAHKSTSSTAASPNSSTITPTPTSSRRCHDPEPSAPRHCSPKWATAATGSPHPKPSCPSPAPRRPPAPAADTAWSPSDGPPTKNFATRSATSPATAGAPTPGPKPATDNCAPRAKPTPTPPASSPAAGPTSSGAAGKTTPPTTPPNTPRSNDSPHKRLDTGLLMLSAPG